MPKTKQIKDIGDIELLKFLKPSAFETLKQRFEGGSKIETVESVFSDPGDDYVDFLADGEIIAHIPGY